jgi:hypothetical protein
MRRLVVPATSIVSTTPSGVSVDLPTRVGGAEGDSTRANSHTGGHLDARLLVHRIACSRKGPSGPSLDGLEIRPEASRGNLLFQKS